MPQWAGSCWYYLRYLDPTNDDALVDPEVERYWMGERRADVGRRRPLRRRRGARGAAPALRALLAQGAVRPRPRVDARAVPPPLQPGHIPAAAYTDERGAYVEATEVEERDGSWFHDGAEVVAPRRQDGQEPEERGRARRHLPRLRRRHAAALRDVHGPARRQPAVEHAATSSACTGSCSGSGATSSTRTPASCTSTDVPADDETRRLLHRTIAAVARRHGVARVQHRDRRADRAQQPAHPGGAASRGARRARWCGRWCSCSRRSPRTSPRSSGRGSARPARSRSPTSPSPTRRCSSTTRRDPGAGQRQGARAQVTVAAGRVGGRPRGRGPRRRQDRRAARRGDGAQGRRRARPHGQLRRRLTRSSDRRLASAPVRSLHLPAHFLRCPARPRRRAVPGGQLAWSEFPPPAVARRAGVLGRAVPRRRPPARRAVRAEHSVPRREPRRLARAVDCAADPSRRPPARLARRRALRCRRAGRRRASSPEWSGTASASVARAPAKRPRRRRVSTTAPSTTLAGTTPSTPARRRGATSGDQGRPRPIVVHVAGAVTHPGRRRAARRARASSTRSRRWAARSPTATSTA